MGKKYQNHVKQKLLKANIGRKRSEWHDKKLLKIISKPIKVFIYETGEYTGEYPSQSECARQLNLDSRRISDIILGKKKWKHYKGYTFKYINKEK